MRRFTERTILPILAVGTLLLTGCARSTVDTEIKPDGSFKRTVKFFGNEPDMKAAGQEGPPGGGLMPSPKVEDVFAIPSGGEWKVKKEKKDKDEVVYTAERTFPAETTYQKDMVVRDEMKKPMLYNLVSVKQIAPGRLQYREEIKWVGPVPKDFNKLPPNVIKVIKATLPAALATPENIEATGKIVNREMWRALFGPGDPMLMQLVAHPDLAMKRIMRRMGAAMDTALEKQFGDKLTLDARHVAVRKIMEAATSEVQSQAKDKTDPQKGPPQSDSPGTMASLLFTVKMPGKIVESNGEVDPVTNEVYWAMYGQGAAAGDCVLTAICEMK